MKKGNRVRFFIAVVLPIFIAFIFELVFTEFKAARLLNVTENLIFSIIILLFVKLFSGSKAQLILSKMVLLFFTFCIFSETGYYYIFDINLRPSAIFIMFESNYSETSEFLSFYLDGCLLTFFLVLVLNCINIISLKRSDLKPLNALSIKKGIIFFVFIILLSLLKYTGLRHQNFPYLLLKSFYVVYFESKVYDLGIYKKEYGIFKKEDNTNSKGKLFVVIIGESTTSNNMSLYGYHRNTNPLLSKIENLSVYHDVISPHAGTTASICKSLTMDNYEGGNNKGSIMQLLNAKGFETYWVSNQQPVGFAETEITKVIYSVKNKFYLNTGNSEDKHLFDEVVFGKVNEVINNTNENQVLFVHLQGTHFFYKNRYPETFNVFEGISINRRFGNSESQEIVNAYDNSVLYNDYVVSTIINKVKETNRESSVIYFSDHGEEVYQTIDFSGHNDDVGTLPMFQIPFLFWQSEKFIEKNDVHIDLDRPYMTDDLFHSIADLCNIKDEHVELERSIFSSKFKSRKRIILNNKDYDSLLVIEKEKQFN